MRKFILSVFLLWGALPIFAQDIITLKDGTDVRAKIIEVTSDAIRYKRENLPEGPTFVEKTANILMITYADGTRDIMTIESVTDNRIFAKIPEAVVEDLDYGDYRRLYDTEDYDKLENPRYSPARCFFNFIVPGIAQYSMHEGGLGTGFLVPSILCVTGITVGTILTQSNKQYKGGLSPEAKAGFLVIGVASAGLLATEIISIVNATKVAKYKSLYLHDLDAVGKPVSVKMDINPFVSPVISGNKYVPAVGLSLTMAF